MTILPGSGAVREIPANGRFETCKKVTTEQGMGVPSTSAGAAMGTRLGGPGEVR